ncbi:MAG: serine/threonine protein kinase [Rhodothermales bacterium]
MPETTRTPVFTRYELLDELGSGGMGAVYKARQKYVGRLVAFKVLPPALRNDAEALQRFEREAAALGRLKHPNVVTVFDAGVESGFPYLAMEFVEGKNLREVLQERGPLPVEEVCKLGIEMAEALDHVQSRGLVHRDLKPSNIILDPQGRSMLTDFGIAFTSTLPRITQGAMGTPEFMSPEQADGKTLDIRSDLYSLGVVLYECLAGRMPFQREGDSLTSLSKLLHEVLHAPPPPLHEQRPDVPAWLTEAIAKCMAKDPDDRFQTGAELADALCRAAGQHHKTPVPASLSEEAPPLQDEHASPPPEPAPTETPAVASTPPTDDVLEPQAPVESSSNHAPPVQPKAPDTTRTKRRQRRRPKAVKKKMHIQTTAPAPLQQESPLPKPAKTKPTATRTDKKAGRPRARIAFRLWLLLGLVPVLMILYEDFGAISLPEAFHTFHVLSLTPALTGAIVTFLAGSKQKSRVWRGLILGTFLGVLFTAALSIIMLEMEFGLGDFSDPSLYSDEALGASFLGVLIAVFSSVVTAIILGIKFRFSSR